MNLYQSFHFLYANRAGRPIEAITTTSQAAVLRALVDHAHAHNLVADGWEHIFDAADDGDDKSLELLLLTDIEVKQFASSVLDAALRNITYMHGSDFLTPEREILRLASEIGNVENLIQQRDEWICEAAAQGIPFHRIAAMAGISGGRVSQIIAAGSTSG